MTTTTEPLPHTARLIPGDYLEGDRLRVRFTIPERYLDLGADLYTPIHATVSAALAAHDMEADLTGMDLRVIEGFRTSDITATVGCRLIAAPQLWQDQGDQA